VDDRAEPDADQQTRRDSNPVGPDQQDAKSAIIVADDPLPVQTARSIKR
jgi:hypothetical protein